jgi:hypothetical protein
MFWRINQIFPYFSMYFYYGMSFSPGIEGQKVLTIPFVFVIDSHAPGSTAKYETLLFSPEGN